MSARALRVAAVQVTSINGAVEANLKRAEALVEEAVAQGAKLVLCPEFLAAGYIYDDAIWKSGERQGGPTETWLCRLARAHAIYIGASYLEADGDDFFNTFALAGPDGSVLGRVRKESLPLFEGWYFKSCQEPKIVATELGKIAVGICQDNHTARFFKRVMRDEPDLLLMPHSAPCLPVGRKTMRNSLSEIGPYYARAFGIPTVVVNKAEARSRSPIPGIPLVKLSFDFPGMSTITNSDGRVEAQLADREGVIVAEVSLDSALKRRPSEPTTFYWSRPPKLLPRALGLFFVALEQLGKRAYGKSKTRVGAARAVAGRRNQPAERESSECVAR